MEEKQLVEGTRATQRKHAALSPMFTVLVSHMREYEDVPLIKSALTHRHDMQNGRGRQAAAHTGAHMRHTVRKSDDGFKLKYYLSVR